MLVSVVRLGRLSSAVLKQKWVRKTISDVQQGLRSNMNYGIVSEMQKRQQRCVGFAKMTVEARS